MRHRVVIVGSGWLGKPLVLHFLQQGVEVVSLTASAGREIELRSLNIPVVNEPLTQWSALPHWRDATVIVTWPPMSADPEGLSRHGALAGILAAVQPQRIFITSSTSVYPDNEETYGDDGVLQMNSKMAETEAVYQGLPRTTFFRLGGLVGPGRHPGKFFASKSNIAKPSAPVNLVHQDDVVACLAYCLEHTDVLPTSVNVVHPDHPTRAEFYAVMTANLQLPGPDFDATDTTRGKTVEAYFLLGSGFLFKHDRLVHYF
jgi:nucleoside-diphosphate-sugar epimerase